MPKSYAIQISIEFIINVLNIITMSTIAEKKLNTMVANIKADNAFSEFNKQNPDLVDVSSCEAKPNLVKVVLRVAMFKKNASVPFYAFIKHSANFAAIVDIQTGAVKIVDSSVIASETEVLGNFRIKRVTYGLKDTVNGFKRYRPLSVAPRKPRKRLSPLSPEVVAAVCDSEAGTEDMDF